MADQGTLSDRTFEIREAAYLIWQSEGCPEGCDVDHWLRAECEVALQAVADAPAAADAPTEVAAPGAEDISASVLRLTAKVNAKRRAGG
jgi:hypothetical protein